jgi:hypothetical protein
MIVLKKVPKKKLDDDLCLSFSTIILLTGQVRIKLPMHTSCRVLTLKKSLERARMKACAYRFSPQGEETIQHLKTLLRYSSWYGTYLAKYLKCEGQCWAQTTALTTSQVGKEPAVYKRSEIHIPPFHKLKKNLHLMHTFPPFVKMSTFKLQLFLFLFNSPTEPRTTEPRMGLLSEWTEPRMGLNPERD